MEVCHHFLICIHLYKQQGKLIPVTRFVVQKLMFAQLVSGYPKTPKSHSFT